ncbi:hypothetical protein DXB59_09410 [Ruminococcus sp. OM05-10BH]|nr:hypothetical protein DXB59_09410 [Ruminococcus sp. OM05-10BH]
MVFFGFARVFSFFYYFSKKGLTDFLFCVYTTQHKAKALWTLSEVPFSVVWIRGFMHDFFRK